MSEQQDADKVPKPKEEKEEAPKETPKEEKEKASKPNDTNVLLNEIEKDLIAELKGKINLEEFAEFDQTIRIKIMRQLKKSIPAKKEETPAPDPNKVKGTPSNPTNPPLPKPAVEIKTNLEKNNMKEFLNDVRKKSSVHNITSQIRGK